MLERLNRRPWKGRISARVSEVRILPHPLIFRVRILGESRLAQSEVGFGFGKDFEEIFGHK